MPFQFTRLEIQDLILVEAQRSEDHRGYFMEAYKQSEFVAGGIPEFVQDNYSHSSRGVLRGLHYQKWPKAQGKLVMAIRGEIFDVAVDIRRESPTYGRWVGMTLSEANGRLLYVPVGFAHGFCVLSDVADVVYKLTAEYAPEYERGIIWGDPDLKITWPVEEPILLARDAAWPRLREADNNF